MSENIEVLCVGLACYDLIFQVDAHPAADEKTTSTAHLACGGGPAANAAISSAKLGCKTAFCGYLGNDLYGDRHLNELQQAGVNPDLIQRGNTATSVAAIIVKPDGQRSIINHTKTGTHLSADTIQLADIRPKVILVDGHQPQLSHALVDQAKQLGIPSILDAGSLKPATHRLMSKVDYLAASEKFARQLSGQNDPVIALQQMQTLSKHVIITLGERGLIWAKDQQTGKLPAFKIKAIDTSGAGDAFHGALATAIAQDRDWEKLLIEASAVAALCCTKMGAQTGMPTNIEVQQFLAKE